MPTLRISRGVQVGTAAPLVEYTDYTDEVCLEVDETLQLGSEGAMTLVTYALVRSRITAIYVVSSEDAEWEVGTGPAYLYLKANVPFIWTRDGASGYDSIPWTSDLSNITMTNEGAVEATVKIRVLMSSR